MMGLADPNAIPASMMINTVSCEKKTPFLFGALPAGFPSFALFIPDFGDGGKS
jgi:hypothetical protein